MIGNKLTKQAFTCIVRRLAAKSHRLVIVPMDAERKELDRLKTILLESKIKVQNFTDDPDRLMIAKQKEALYVPIGLTSLYQRLIKENLLMCAFVKMSQPEATADEDSDQQNVRDLIAEHPKQVFAVTICDADSNESVSEYLDREVE